MFQFCSTKHHEIIQPVISRDVEQKEVADGGEEPDTKAENNLGVIHDIPAQPDDNIDVDTTENCWAHDISEHDYFLSYRAIAEGKPSPNSTEVLKCYFCFWGFFVLNFN